MEWKVTNALNRDVERQNLNKILAEIRAAINSASATNTNNTPTNIQDVVGTMVSGNKESGITVSYNSAAKLLDFVISSFTLRLTGDIEGSATINGLQSATIETVLNPSLHGVEEAPIDNNFYWRQNAAWEPVDQGLSSFAQLRGTGFPAQRQDATEGESLWDLRTLQPPAAGITITNPAGEAGDPTFGLANDLAALEGLGSTGIAVRTATDTWAQRQIDVAIGELTVSNPAGVAGNPTLGLADVTDSGVGVTPMRLFTRDSKGRISGTQAASTTNLTEGSNLYFTAARVLSTVLTGLSTATNAVITAADTVLSALGKLQAQITANAAIVSGLVIDSIADSDTTHAPSRNAVFDALALKQPLDSDLTTIAAITPVDDDIIQRKAGAWANRTMAQLAVDLTGVVHTTGAENVGGPKVFTDDLDVAHTGAVLVDITSTDNVATQIRFISNSPTNRRFLGQSSPGVTESQINFGTGEIHFWGAAIANKLLHISSTSVDADEDNVKTCGSSTNRWSAVWSVTPAAGDNTDKCATTAYAILAAPNPVYRTLLDCSGSHTAARIAGTYAMGQGVPLAISGTGTLYPINVIAIKAADYPTVNGLTTKLRIRGQIAVNDVAPTGNYTFGLYPLTRPATSGGAGLATYTLGTVVTGSNGATVSTPAADAFVDIVGSDFALPADGLYCIGVVTTATVAASSHLHLNAQLQMHST